MAYGDWLEMLERQYGCRVGLAPVAKDPSEMLADVQRLVREVVRLRALVDARDAELDALEGEPDGPQDEGEDDCRWCGGSGGGDAAFRCACRFDPPKRRSHEPG